KPYRSTLGKCDIAVRELVVAGCYAPIALDLVEELLDQVASQAKYGLKLGASVRSLLVGCSPGGRAGGRDSDPIGVIAVVGERYRSRIQAKSGVEAFALFGSLRSA